MIDKNSRQIRSSCHSSLAMQSEINPTTGQRWKHGDLCENTGRVFKQFDQKRKSGAIWYSSMEVYHRRLELRRVKYVVKMKDETFAESEKTRKKILMRKRRELGLCAESDRKHKQNPEYKAKQAIYSKQRNAKLSVKIQRRKREKRKAETDPLFKLRKTMRCRLYQALKVKGWIKNGPSEKMIGCTFAFLKEYLSVRFKVGMTWENYGSVWHVDHVIPLSAATSKRRLKRLCRYDNLCPEYALDNISKGAKQLKQMPLL